MVLSRYLLSATGTEQEGQKFTLYNARDFLSFKMILVMTSLPIDDAEYQLFLIHLIRGILVLAFSQAGQTSAIGERY